MIDEIMKPFGGRAKSGARASRIAFILPIVLGLLLDLLPAAASDLIS
jgi:hypothetical protein